VGGRRGKGLQKKKITIIRPAVHWGGKEGHQKDWWGKKGTKVNSKGPEKGGRTNWGRRGEPGKERTNGANLGKGGKNMRFPGPKEDRP